MRKFWLVPTLVLLGVALAIIYRANAAPLYFNGNSVWNKPITNTTLMNGSSSMIQPLAGRSVDLIGINWGGSSPVAYAQPTDPLVTVRGMTFHLPTSAQADSGSDGKLMVIDGGTGYSFYRFNRTNLTAEAGGSGDITASGDGLTVNVWGGRATGWMYLPGLIMKSEIQAGKIEHALAISLPVGNVASGYIWPARASDGSGGSIPMGARIYLDPSINVDNLPLDTGGKIIARALQIYGAWVADTNSGELAFYVEEFTDANGNPDPAPWSGLLQGWSLQGLPVASLRVLAAANPNDFYPLLTSPTSVPIATNTPTVTTNTPIMIPTFTPAVVNCQIQARYSTNNNNWKTFWAPWPCNQLGK